MSETSEKTVSYDHENIQHDKLAALALRGVAKRFPVLKLQLTPIDKELPNVFSTVVKVGKCGTDLNSDDLNSDDSSEQPDDSGHDETYSVGSSDYSTDSEGHFEEQEASEIEVTPLSPEVEKQTLQKDRRNSAFQFHWDKVQYHMRHILKKASEEYVSTSGGKLTVRNTVFAHNLVSTGEALKKSGNTLVDAGIDLLKYIESGGRTDLVSGIWLCEACGTLFDADSDMKACMRKHEQDKLEKLTCQICRKSFLSESGIQNHLDLHVNGPFKCWQCEKVFGSKSRRDACAKAHGQPGFACEKCGKTYSRRDTLKDHMHTHGEARNFFCPICGAGFMNDNMKRQHVHKVHVKKFKAKN